MGTNYADAGVDRDLGDDVSKILYNAAKETWANRSGRLGHVMIPFDDFSGLRYINTASLPPGTVMNIGFDGVGTKVLLAQQLNDHSTVAYDLIAMVSDDAVVRGAEPVIAGSILDVSALKDTRGRPYLNQVRQIAHGYIDAAKEADIAIVNGEVAELGTCVGGFGNPSFINHLAHRYIAQNLHEGNLTSISALSAYLTEPQQESREKLLRSLAPAEREFVQSAERMQTLNYNWGAAVIWFAHKDRLLSGKNIRPGDTIVSLREHGFRSNGISLVRKILTDTYGINWHESEKGRQLGQLTLLPSRIYTRAIVEMTGGYEGEPMTKVHGIAHITGGGIPGKLERALKPASLGADITDPFPPPMAMAALQELGGVSDEEAYRSWNMGNGMLIITPDPEGAIAVAGKHSIEARVAGTVTKVPGIRIASKGANGNSVLHFNP